MFGSIGWTEILFIGLLAVLIFGKRLPEVGRNLGRGFIEFKKGLQGIQDDVESAGKPQSSSHSPRQLDGNSSPSADLSDSADPQTMPHDKSQGA